MAPLRLGHVNDAIAVAPSAPSTRPFGASDRTLGIVGICFAVVALSAGSTMVRSTGAPGPVVAFWRLLVGTILWRAILIVTKQKFTLAALKRTCLPGLLFGLNLMFFFTGINKTRIANAEFIGTLAPLIIVPVAAWRLGERVKGRIIIAGAAALLGVSLILLLADRKVVGSHSWFGDFMCVCAVVTWSSYLFSTKSARRELGVGPFMTGMSAVATLTVLPVALSTHKIGQMSTKGWILIAVMCVTSGVVSHGLLAWSQKAVPISTLSLIQLAQPGFAVVWAWMFLNESVNPAQLLGMAIVLGAVGVIARVSTGRGGGGGGSGVSGGSGGSLAPSEATSDTPTLVAGVRL